MNVQGFDPKTLTTTTITLDDIEELKELCCYSNSESKPALLDGEYIGDINSFGELLIPSSVKKDFLEGLIGENHPSNKVLFGVDYGNGISQTVECIYHREITNIHRVRKGKRYIIKFDYTGLMGFIGKVKR